MAIESPRSSTVHLRLNTGLNGSGGIKTATISLGKIMYAADKNKIMSVVGTLLPCLVHPMYRVERREITTIEN